MSEIKIDKPVRLIELFSGVGAQAMALRDLGVNFKHWKTCEWDINAIKSYWAIHCGNDTRDYSEGYTKEELVDILYGSHISGDGKTAYKRETLARKNEQWLRDVYNCIVATLDLVDISTVHGRDLEIEDTDKYCYIMTYSYPCTDISLAGKMEGMSKGSGTRSSLLWEVERILNELKAIGGGMPQVLLMENVPQVHGEKNVADFNSWIEFLGSIGYSNYWADLNAKDYGVAQSRDRCYMVSLYGDETYEFPVPVELTRRMRDYIDDDVADHYFIKSERADAMIADLVNRGVLDEERERERERVSDRSASTELQTIQDAKMSRTQSPQKTGYHRPAETQITWSVSRNKLGGKLDIAKTLCVKDLVKRGCHQLMNGVIEDR